MLHYSIIALIVYMHIVCIYMYIYMYIYIYVTRCLCRAGFASVPCYLLNLAQVGRDSMGYIARLTVNGITVSSRLCRIRACHHVPWRAMEPWCDEICWLSSPHCQVHKVIPGRWLFEVRSMQKRNGWKEMEHAATPSHLLKSYPPFLEKSIKSMNRIARVYSNRTNMAQICANSESMLALSVHPEAIASGFASSVGGPEMAVERDFTGFPVAKVAFLLDLVALVSKSAVEVVAFTISPCYSLRL